jgi:hypothetical protein
MAIADLDAYRAALLSQREPLTWTNGTMGTSLGRMFSSWRTAAPIGGLPTNEAPNNTTPGALPLAASSLTQSVIGARVSLLSPGTLLLVDILSHTSGMSGNVSGGQTTNLPTAALTRHTSGVGVMAGLMIWAQIGTTAVTATVTYTNQAGTGSRTGTCLFGSTPLRSAHQVVPFSLQAGDTGVRAVSEVSLSAGTGFIGDFGVVLFKPLYAVLATDLSGVLSSAGFLSGNVCGGIPEISNDACLCGYIIPSGGTSGVGAASFLLAEH